MNTLFACAHCHAELGPLGQSHLENSEDGREMWSCSKPLYCPVCLDAIGSPDDMCSCDA